MKFDIKQYAVSDIDTQQKVSEICKLLDAPNKPLEFHYEVYSDDIKYAVFDKDCDGVDSLTKVTYDEFVELCKRSEKPEYPCYKKSNCTVLFTGPKTGYCVDTGTTSHFLHQYLDCWSENLFVPCKDPTVVRKKYKPKHKELVLCWDDDYKSGVDLSYYNAETDTTYGVYGKSSYNEYDNYLPYTGEIPPNLIGPEELEG